MTPKKRGSSGESDSRATEGITRILRVAFSRVSQFELEQFEQSGGRLRVLGRWSDVRGMRFMRPTLTVGDRRVLAVLDHKPWMPEEGQTWIAEFPWDGDVADIDRELAELAVAPSVAVSLASPGVPVEPLGEPEPSPLALEEERRHRLESEVAFLREQIDLLKERLEETEQERDEARAAATPPPEEEPQEDERIAQLEADIERARAERDNARERLDDERTRRAKAEEDYDRLRIERDAAQHEAAHLREELAEREVELPDEPASGTIVVPAPPPEPIKHEEPAPFVQALEIWIPRALLVVFVICVLLLVLGAVKIF
jgi:hypothetical protein